MVSCRFSQQNQPIEGQKEFQASIAQSSVGHARWWQWLATRYPKLGLFWNQQMSSSRRTLLLMIIYCTYISIHIISSYIYILLCIYLWPLAKISAINDKASFTQNTSQSFPSFFQQCWSGLSRRQPRIFNDVVPLLYQLLWLPTAKA